MNTDQTLGQVRAFLTAAGAALAVWGVDDGNSWAPLTGVATALISVLWGIIHHVDAGTPGTIKWSLVRKLVNALGTAGITYGILNPEKVEGVQVLVAAAGPLLASWFSWLDNDSDEYESGSGINSLWILAFICLGFLPSCVTTTTTYPDGSVTVVRSMDPDAVALVTVTTGEVLRAKILSDK